VSFHEWKNKKARTFGDASVADLDIAEHDYCVPSGERFPCFDSYGFAELTVNDDEGKILATYKGLVGFQMTIAKSHDVISGDEAKCEFEKFLVKAESLRQHGDKGLPWYIFVIPESLEGQFRPNFEKAYAELVKGARIFVMQLCLEKRAADNSRSLDKHLTNVQNDDKHTNDESHAIFSESQKRLGKAEFPK
jgi:hypothetical protein